MAKQAKDQSPASAKVAWVKQLPNGGGAWGSGIINTVASMESDLDPLIEKLDELDRAVKARESILSDAVKRAAREAKGLFNEEQIAKAMKPLTPTDPGDKR